VGLAGAGLALSLSGHAGTVEPQWLMRSVVFLHGVCVAFWVGAFLPLIVAVRGGDTRALARFSKIIPLPLVVIVFTGLKLAFTQLDRFDALWTTTYGLALSGKLAAVIGLFALGAANRYALVPAFQRASMVAQPLLRSMKVELVLALAILALVASWRFTPPPRALAAAHVSVHLHSAKAMAQIDIDPERARGAHVEIQVLNGEMGPLAAKEVALVLANPAAGIEPVRRNAQGAGADWRIDDLRIPVAGRWRMRVEILINDFEKAVVEDEVTLPRLP
jgi:copper transport protein